MNDVQTIPEFSAFNPRTAQKIGTPFREATSEEIDDALVRATNAFEAYADTLPEQRARFLEAIAKGLSELGSELVETADEETALGSTRLDGELGRTTSQLKMFADLLREGSWVDARIDRQANLRSMLIPVGPVAVFSASNFPFAFSVAGGDTASALAAGCPVVVKAHPAHPHTSQQVAQVIEKAAETCQQPAGVFSLLQGASHRVGLELVQHPLTKAVGFTGSLTAGRALMDAAAARPHPIPVYAEMGSVNPIFVLPDQVNQKGEVLAEELAGSVALGVGQFCTNPGLIIGVKGDALTRLKEQLAQQLEAKPAAAMLYDGIRQKYLEGVERASSVSAVTRSGSGKAEATEVTPVLLSTDVQTFLSNDSLSQEVFGPVTLLIEAREDELADVAQSLEGQLTVTLHATETDLRDHTSLVNVLKQAAGRLIFNGVPTGVAVSSAMHHGGPYPASSNARYTSVGTAATSRFVRPLCFQAAPQKLLPPALQDANPLNLLRLVEGAYSREAL